MIITWAILPSNIFKGMLYMDKDDNTDIRWLDPVESLYKYRQQRI